MSDKKINLIIIFIVILAIIISFVLMEYSPKKNNLDPIDKFIEVDKIKILNEDIDKNINTNVSYFTISLSNYVISDKTINLAINVKKNKNATIKIDKVLVNNNSINFNTNEEIIDFKIGTIKENNKDKFIYITTTTSSLDGEGDVIIINNIGNILYQNKSAFLEELDNEKYLIKEKYCDVLINLVCKDNNTDAIAFKNLTYKSINGQLVNIDYQELKIKDVCYD